MNKVCTEIYRKTKHPFVVPFRSSVSNFSHQPPYLSPLRQAREMQRSPGDLTLDVVDHRPTTLLPPSAISTSSTANSIDYVAARTPSRPSFRLPKDHQGGSSSFLVEIGNSMASLLLTRLDIPNDRWTKFCTLQTKWEARGPPDVLDIRFGASCNHANQWTIASASTAHQER
jgi:hypothetical protein